MKKGFTLVEIIIVLIIIAIMASVGLAQYSKVVEKSRWMEARTILGSLRTLGIAYTIDTGGSAASVAALDDSVPSACAATNFFSYGYAANTGTATRCAAGGKSPQGTADSAGKTKTLTEAGVWSGTGTNY